MTLRAAVGEPLPCPLPPHIVITRPISGVAIGERKGEGGGRGGRGKGRGELRGGGAGAVADMCGVGGLGGACTPKKLVNLVHIGGRT